MWITMCIVYFPIKIDVDSYVEKMSSYLHGKLWIVDF